MINSAYKLNILLSWMKLKRHYSPLLPKKIKGCTKQKAPTGVNQSYNNTSLAFSCFHLYKNVYIQIELQFISQVNILNEWFRFHQIVNNLNGFPNLVLVIVCLNTNDI